MSYSAPDVPSLETFPVGGDPGALTAHGNALINTSQLLAGHGQHIGLVNEALLTHWSGKSANSFDLLSTGIAGSFGGGATTLESAAGSIFRYAGDLDGYQQQAKSADEQSKDWHKQIVTWTRNVKDAQNALTAAQNDLSNAQHAQTIATHQPHGQGTNLASANQAVTNAQQKVATAQHTLRHAQEELAQAHEQFKAWQDIARQIQDEAHGRGESFGTELTSFTLSPPAIASGLWGDIKGGVHDITTAGSGVFHAVTGIGGVLGGILKSLSHGDIGINDTGYGDVGNNDSGNGDVGNNDSGDGDVGNNDSGNGDVGNNDSGNGDVGDGDSGDGDVGSHDSGNGDVGNNDSGNGDVGDGDSGDGDVGNSDSGNGDVGSHDSGNGDVGNNDAGNGEVGDDEGKETLSTERRPDLYTTEERIEHIKDRHFPDTTAQNVGKYSPGTTEADVKADIQEAVENGQERPNTNGRPGKIYEEDLGHTIGTNKEGQPTSEIRVVVAPDGKVITAFPI